MEQYNKSFAGYIKELREKQNVPLARLCNGVCSANLIKQFEKKEKGVSKNIQDCLLGRLGIGAEGYFYLLGIEEYREWHARAEIIYEIIRRRLDSAEEMLSGYEKMWCDNSLNRQFYYAMMASIARWRKKTRQEIYSLWEAAKNETIPKVGKKNIQNYRLSVQELDILLDYYYYKEESTEKDFRVVLDYIGSHPYDEQAKGKTLPKAFLYYSEKVKEEKELTVELIHELLAEATEIVEIMRERDQMLFLWEMLQFRSELYYLLREKGSEKGKSDEEKKNAGWLWAFEKVYEYFDFPKETTETTILYFTKNVECVNETIRKRRRLLGYSRRQLAKFGDCTERTIERIEKKECSPQKEVAGAILEAMGMPADYSKCALIVEKPGDRDLAVELERAIMRYEHEKAKAYRRREVVKSVVKNVNAWRIGMGTLRKRCGLLLGIAVWLLSTSGCGIPSQNVTGDNRQMRWKEQRCALEKWHGTCYTVTINDITYNVKADVFNQNKVEECIQNIEKLIDYSNIVFEEKSDAFSVFLGFDTENKASAKGLLRLPMTKRFSADSVWAIVKKAHTRRLNAGEFYGLFYRYAVAHGICEGITIDSNELRSFFAEEKNQQYLDFCIPMLDDVFFLRKDAEMVRDAVASFATFYSQKYSLEALEILCKVANIDNEKVQDAKKCWLKEMGITVSYDSSHKINFRYASKGLPNLENTYEIAKTDVIWCWDDVDVKELGYGTMVAGYEELEKFRVADWKKARDLLKDYIPPDMGVPYLVTNFIRLKGNSSLAGRYYPSDQSIRLYSDWSIAKQACLHEYCHFLTLGEGKLLDTERSGSFVEWVAVWMEQIELIDRARIDEWNKKEKQNLQNFKYYTYKRVLNDYENHRFEEKTGRKAEGKVVEYPVCLPTVWESMDTYGAAYDTFGCPAKYVYDMYGLDKLADLGKSNMDCKNVLHISFDELYFNMIIWVKKIMG